MDCVVFTASCVRDLARKDNMLTVGRNSTQRKEECAGNRDARIYYTYMLRYTEHGLHFGAAGSVGVYALRLSRGGILHLLGDPQYQSVAFVWYGYPENISQ